MISVVVTCYNLGAYLHECISSIYSSCNGFQFEVILVDDGSTDNVTIEVIDDLLLKFPDIIIIRQANLGLASARNVGINKSKYDLVIPFDADNKMERSMILKSAEIFHSNENVDIIYGNALFFGMEQRLWPQKEYSFIDLCDANYIDACACFKKSVFVSLGGYDTKMPVMGFEDWDFWLRASVKGFRFKFIDQVFFNYRVRDNSMLSKAWEFKNDLERYIFSKHELANLLEVRLMINENKRLKKRKSGYQLLNELINRIKNRFYVKA